MTQVPFRSVEFNGELQRQLLIPIGIIHYLFVLPAGKHCVLFLKFQFVYFQVKNIILFSQLEFVYYCFAGIGC